MQPDPFHRVIEHLPEHIAMAPDDLQAVCTMHSEKELEAVLGGGGQAAVQPHRLEQEGADVAQGDLHHAWITGAWEMDKHIAW